MSSGFTPDVGTKSTPPDPTKHVNYTLGMILGVDEFTQEFAYLSERDRWTARDLCGYGTSSGLRVGSRMNGSEPEITVSPGLAVSPYGRLLRVTPTQCAQLNAWLQAHRQDLIDRGTPVLGPSTVRLYVVLGYRARETDLLPIPGEPCRNEADTVQPSRLTDDYQLDLRLSPPDQSEEEAIRDFVNWLRNHISPSTVPGSSVTMAVFQAALRSAVVAPPLSPPAWPPFSPGSPPDFLLDASPPGPFTIYIEDLRAYLREAFRIWVTELRPMWRPNWLGDVHSCMGTIAPERPADGDSVLLAAVDVPITRILGGGDWTVKTEPSPADPLSKLAIVEDDRPWLLGTRLLQEWLLEGKALAGPKGDKGDPGTPGAPGAPGAPASPDAVLHAPGLGAFTVVAAGWIAGNGSTSGYNGLKVAGSAAGLIVLAWSGMPAPPPANLTGNLYVNVMLANPPPPAAAPAPVKTPSLIFAGNKAAGGGLPAGLNVQVLDAGLPVALPIIQALFFMVEVSQFA